MILTKLGTAAWRRLLLLDRPVPPRSDAEIEAEVERNFTWNFTVNLLEGTAFWIGLSFISVSTIVPLFVSKLTPNPLIIGLVAVIGQAGWHLPQIFTAGYTERLARKKPVIVNLGFFVERVPVWLWPLAALLALREPTLALVLFFVGYAWHNVGAGLIGPAWQDLIAVCFPVNRRGRFWGSTTFIGTALGTIGALGASWLLETYEFPTNFVYIFLIAAMAIAVSWFFISLTREPVRPPVPNPHPDPQLRFRLLRIVRQDANFRRFLTARLLLAWGSMGAAFVTVSAVQRWRVPDGTVGLYTAVLLVGQSSGNLFAGWLADRRGHKVCLEISSIASVVAFALAWLAPSPAWYYAVFAFWGFSLGTTIVSAILIALEFAPPAQRPTYVGIANTSVGLVYALAPLVGAGLAAIGYGWVFALSAGTSLLAWATYRWRVQDPRWQSESSNGPNPPAEDATRLK